MSKATDALTAVKTLWTGLGVTAHIYPDEYSSVNTGSFPFVVVSESLKQAARWRQLTVERAERIWTAECILFLADGPLLYPDATAATAEKLGQEYAEDFYAALTADQTLGGVVLRAGNVGDGLLFTDWGRHSQWNQDVFWSIVFEIPIVQSHEVT